MCRLFLQKPKNKIAMDNQLLRKSGWFFEATDVEKGYIDTCISEWSFLLFWGFHFWTIFPSTWKRRGPFYVFTLRYVMAMPEIMTAVCTKLKTLLAYFWCSKILYSPMKYLKSKFPSIIWFLLSFSFSFSFFFFFSFF